MLVGDSSDVISGFWEMCSGRELSTFFRPPHSSAGVCRWPGRRRKTGKPLLTHRRTDGPLWVIELSRSGRWNGRGVVALSDAASSAGRRARLPDGHLRSGGAIDRIPFPRYERKLPVILSPAEVQRLLEDLQIRNLGRAPPIECSSISVAILGGSVSQKNI
jgi:hypothetical protein